MLTYFMFKEFFRSGEFDPNKNEYAVLEGLLRIPFCVLLDLLLIAQTISYFTNQ